MRKYFLSYICFAYDEGQSAAEIFLSNRKCITKELRKLDNLDVGVGGMIILK
jgi:hypothetical protein